MTLNQISQLNNRTYHLKLALTNWFRAPTINVPGLQWAIIGATGMGLGVYVLGLFSLPADRFPLFMLAVLCPFLMMIVGNVRKTLLAIIILEIPIQIDTYLDYHKSLAHIGTVSGYNISLTTVCLVVLYSLWLAELSAKVATFPTRLLRTSLPMLIYLAVVLLSVTVAKNAVVSFYEINILFQAFLLYYYIVHAVRTREDVLFVVTLLLIGLVLQAIIMIGLRGIGSDLRIGSIFARIDNNGRVGGTFGSPNGTAGYLVSLLAPALSLLLTQTGGWHKRLAAIGFGLGSIALILTLSRGGWTGAIMSILLLFFLAWRRGWLPISLPIVLSICVLVIVILFQDVVLTRLTKDDGGSAESRIPLNRIAYQMIQDHPILGVGANNFGVSLPTYVTPEFGQAWIYTVHNKYLLVWAETGIGALLAFIWFLLTVIGQSWQIWKWNDRFLSPLALGFAAGLIGNMFHMTVDIFHGRPQVLMLWLLVGLIVAMSNMRVNGNVDKIEGKALNLPARKTQQVPSS